MQVKLIFSVTEEKLEEKINKFLNDPLFNSVEVKDIKLCCSSAFSESTFNYLYALVMYE